MTTIVSIAQGGTGARTAANARIALDVPPSAAYDQANTARTQANTAYGQANAAYGQANAAYGQANAAYGAANTRLSASGGTLSGDLIITGNLTVSGNSTTLNTEILTVEDADVVLLSNVAGTPALNAGVIVNRGTSTNTFLRWAENIDEWGWSDNGTTTYFFEDLRQGLITTNTSFGTVNTNITNTNSNAVNAYAQANAAYAQANSAYGAANNRVLKAGDTMTGNLTISGATLNTATANITTIVTGNALTISTGTASNGNIIFSANGTEDMRITAPGNVGIGTTSPSALLHMYNSTAGSEVARFEGNYSASGSVVLANFRRNGGAVAAAIKYYDDPIAISLGTTTNHPLAFRTNDSERLYITSGGNVGIGTTSPLSKLVISDGSNKNLEVQPGATTYLLAYDRTAGDYLNLDIAAQVLIFSTDIGAERMRITADGNVGIGTTNPGTKLDVDGNARIRSSLYLGFADSASGHINAYELMTFNIDSDNDDSDTRYFAWYKNGADGGGTELLRLTESGNVGIGTTNPGYKIEVTSAIGSYWNGSSFTGTPLALSITNSTSGGYDPVLIFQQADSGGTIKNAGAIGLVGTSAWTAGSNGTQVSDMYFLVRNSSGGISERMRIKSDGNVGIGTTSPGTNLHIYRSGQPPIVQTLYASLLLETDSTSNYQRIRYDVGGTPYWGLDRESTTNDFMISGRISSTWTDGVIRIKQSNGNVGIGTTNPISKFHIRLGASGVSSPYADGLVVENNGRAAINLLSPNTSDGYIFFGDPQSNVIGYVGYEHPDNSLRFNSGDNIFWMIGASTKMFLNSSGNLGIGTTNPGSKLHLYDGSNPLSLTIQRTTVPVFLSDVQLASTTAAASWSHNMKDTSNASESWSAFTNTAYAGSAIRLVADTSTSQIRFMTATAANSNPSERIRITGSGGLVLGSDASGTHVQFSAVKTGISDSTTTSLFRIKSNSNQIYGFLEIHYALDDPGNQSYDGRVAYRVFHNGGTTLLDSITSEVYSTVPTFSGTASGGNFDISINFNSGATTYKVAYYVTFTCHDNSQSVINVEEL